MRTATSPHSPRWCAKCITLEPGGVTIFNGIALISTRAMFRLQGAAAGYDCPVLGDRVAKQDAPHIRCVPSASTTCVATFVPAALQFAS